MRLDLGIASSYRATIDRRLSTWLMNADSAWNGLPSDLGVSGKAVAPQY